MWNVPVQERGGPHFNKFSFECAEKSRKFSDVIAIVVFVVGDAVTEDVTNRQVFLISSDDAVGYSGAIDGGSSVVRPTRGRRFCRRITRRRKCSDSEIRQPAAELQPLIVGHPTYYVLPVSDQS
jgi:hypothetical protein